MDISNVFRRAKTLVFRTCPSRKCSISAHILCSVEVTRTQLLGNAHVVILDFLMKSHARRKNDSGAAQRGEHTHFGDFEFFSRQFSAGTSMLRLSWSFLQAWVFIEISKIVLCANPKRFIAVGFRNDEIWFKNRKLAWVHLGKTRILVL